MLPNQVLYMLGETISWTVTYDAALGDHFTTYLDGVDGAANRGANDDTLQTLSCLNADYSSDCGRSLVDENYTALYDSNSDISSIYNAMVNSLGINETVYDYFDFNKDARSYRSLPYPDFTQYDFYADEFHIYADNRQDIAGGVGYAQLFYEDDAGEVWGLRVGLGNINISSSEVPSAVPIPAAMWLFGSGFIALMGLARRKS